MTEHVYLVALPNDHGGLRVISNIVGVTRLIETVGPNIGAWTTRADVGDHYHDGRILVVRTGTCP